MTLSNLPVDGGDDGTWGPKVLAALVALDQADTNHLATGHPGVYPTLSSGKISDSVLPTTSNAATVAAAQSAANAAQTTANTAVTNAATAQSTANTALANAATAQTTANTAQTTANTANTTANTANSTAATASADVATLTATVAGLSLSVTARPVRFLIGVRNTDNPDYLVNPTTGVVTRTSDSANLGTGANFAWADALAGCGTYQNRAGLIQWTDGTFHLRGPLRMDTGIAVEGATNEGTQLIVDSAFSVGGLTGSLDATNGVPRCGVFTPDWQTANAYTGGRWEIRRLKILMGSYAGTDLCGINYTTDAQPSFIAGTRGVDPGLRIEDVIVDQSPTHGIALVTGGYSGGGRESRIINCEVAKSGRLTTGWDFWLDSSDLYLIGCTGNGARSGGFAGRGGNHRYTNCKAYFSGNVSTTFASPGFDISSARALVTGCEAQDNGGEGFLIRAKNVSVTGCMSDSNGAYTSGGVRNVQQSSNFACTANNVVLDANISIMRTGGNGDPGYPFWFSASRTNIAGTNVVNRDTGTWTVAASPYLNNVPTSSDFTVIG